MAGAVSRGLTLVIAMTLGAVAFVGGRAGAEQPAIDSVLVEAGRHEYERYCSACHGVHGLGDGPVAGVLKHKPADLTIIKEHNGGQFPAGRVAMIIDGRSAVTVHGTREMPVWGERLNTEIPNPDTKDEVTRGRISLIVEYLESIQH